MIELERHIEILLLDNDCVIVPNLGGFMAHHVEARYDGEEQLFLPPLRTLGFNPKLRLNDSLLAQSYIEAYDISYPEAVNRIEEEVNELKQILNNEGCYELNDIGTLSMNEDGNYEFMPCEAGILTPSLYGLNSFEMDTIDSAILTDTLVSEPAEKRLEQETKVVDLNVSKEEDTETSDAKTISIRVSAIRNTVAIAAALIAFFLITTPLGTGTPKGMNLSNVENSMLYRVLPKEVTSTKIDVKLQKDTSQTEKTTEITTATSTEQVAQNATATANEQTVAAPTRYWSIVLASKVSKKNAQAFVKRLSQLGYQHVSLLNQKSGIRVIYGHYASEKQAYNVLNSLHGQEPFQEAWVYEIKDN